jgi:hypothetical protein
LTAQTASGMEAARAWPGLLHGTWEPVAPILSPTRWGGVERENSKRTKPRGAEYRCGARGRTVS